MPKEISVRPEDLSLDPSELSLSPDELSVSPDELSLTPTPSEADVVNREIAAINASRQEQNDRNQAAFDNARRAELSALAVDAEQRYVPQPAQILNKAIEAVPAVKPAMWVGRQMREGAEGIIKGTPGVVRALSKVALVPLTEDEQKAGMASAHELIQGIFQVSTPAIVAGAAANPVGTGWALLKAALAARVGEEAAEAVGASPEAQALAGDIGALASGLKSVDEFVTGSMLDAAKVAAKAAKAKGAAWSLAAKLNATGYGPGDVPGYRALSAFEEPMVERAAREQAQQRSAEGSKEAAEAIAFRRGVPEQGPRATAPPIENVEVTPEAQAAQDVRVAMMRAAGEAPLPAEQQQARAALSGVSLSPEEVQQAEEARALISELAQAFDRDVQDVRAEDLSTTPEVATEEAPPERQPEPEPEPEPVAVEPARELPPTPPVAQERQKRDDGRLEPQAGDKVYQVVPGFGGTPAYINGVVVAGKNGLRVKVTSSGSIIGASGPGVGKTFAMGPAWTVENDPEVARRKQIREDAESARRAEIAEGNAAHVENLKKAQESEFKRGFSPLTKETPVGARVRSFAFTDPDGQPLDLYVTEQSQYGPVVGNKDEIGTGSGTTIGNAESDGSWLGFAVYPQSGEREKARAEARRSARPFAYDLEQWKANQREMGWSDDEIAEAVRQTTAVGIDPTKSDDLNDLERYLNAIEDNDDDWNDLQREQGHYQNPELITWAKQQGGANAVPVESPARLDAREQAGDGEAVGEGNAEREVPAPAREEVAAVQEAIEAARAEVNTEPTEAQKEAGNYKKGHVTIHGLDITIENPEGSVRSGKSKTGEDWSTTMPADYGYIKRTEGADGDHVDVYIGPSPESGNVYVIDQVDLDTGKFDEHKVVMGVDSVLFAKGLYARGFSDGRGYDRIGHIAKMSVDEFKDWLKGDTSKPVAAEQAKTPKVMVNTDRDSVEVSFPEKPDRLVLDKLKAAGFRWAKTNKVWYRKSSSGKAGLDNVASQARKIVGIDEPQPPPRASRTPTADLIPSLSPVEPRATARQQETPRPAGGWKPLGVKNSFGYDLYENEKGQRSYVDAGGDRNIEPAAMHFSRGGITPTFEHRDPYREAEQPKPAAEEKPSAPKTETPQARANTRRQSEQNILAILKAGNVDALSQEQVDIIEAALTEALEKEGVSGYASLGYLAANGWDNWLESMHVFDEGSIAQVIKNAQYDLSRAPQKEEPRGDDADTRELQAGGDRTTGGDRAGRKGTLGAVSAEDVRKPEATREEQPGRGDTGGVLADRVRDDAADGEEPGIVTPRGGADHPSPVAVSPTGATHDPGHAPLDYILTPERIKAIVGRGDVTRAVDNLAAIDLVKKLQAEDRYATAEEQDVLAKYVGWGASEVSQYLESYPRGGWSANERAIHARLQKLPEAERKALGHSRLNAHYTFELYQPIWEALANAGFAGGHILEPAVGTGHAFGMMPPDMRVNSTLSASELEPLTAAIAGYLYPSATVQAVGYQNIMLARGTQDLVISNVPFGDYGVDDPLMPKVMRERIHNYFFAKALEHARVGGLVVFVTSRYTMDNVKFSGVRDYLAERADFIGAVRLPNTAFGKTAKTEVVTDLIILRKREEGAEPSPSNALFQTSEEHPTLRGRGGQRIYRSRWYSEHPEYILGRESMEGTQYAKDSYTVEEPERGVLTLLRSELQRILLPGTYTRGARAPRKATKLVERGTYKHGEFRVGEKGTIERVDASGEVSDATPMRNGKPDKGAVQRIAGMVGIRDALRETVSLMGDTASTDAQIQKAQKTLTKRYNAYVAEFGSLNDALNKRLFSSDPESTNLLALERLEAKAKEVTRQDGSTTLSVKYEVVGRSDIFTKRTIHPTVELTSVKTSKDALLASLAQHQALDWRYMERLVGKPVAEMQRELQDAGLVFEQPDGSHVLAEEYLSGDVVTKLEDATAANRKGKFAAQVAALEAVQPKAKTYEDIDTGEVAINLGAAWVDTADYQRFIAAELNVGERDSRVSVASTSTLVRWSVKVTDRSLRASDQHPLAVQYGPEPASEGGKKPYTYGFIEMITDALNLKLPELSWYEGSGKDRRRVVDQDATIAARANIELLQKAWAEFVYKTEGVRDRVLNIYNTRYNRTVERTFDGSHMTYPGMATLYNTAGKPIKFHKHQNNGVWRILASGNTLLAHEVGAGKTFEMIAAAMEMRRTGRARKPMITVPTYLLAQWRRDILTLYPNARVAAFDNKDLEGKKRQAAMARIAYGDWDVVLVPHSSFGLLKVSEERMISVMEGWRKELESLVNQLGDDPNSKQAERQKAKIEDKIRKLRDRLKERSNDNAITWEQLGVDALFVDEAHEFKNLFFYSKLENLRGLSRSEADRSLDMFVKVQAINEMSGNRNLVFATATPLMNSMAEVYAMQRYLQPQALRQAGFDNFDNWYAMFAKATLETEQQPDGSYKEVRRLRDFSNLALLSRLVRQVMDFVGWEDMPYLKLPKIAGGQIEVVQTQEHPMYPKLREWFTERMAAIKQTPPRYDHNRKKYIAPERHHPLTGKPMGKFDNILTIMNDAKKAAIDVRLVLGDAAADVQGSRVQVAAAKMAEIYKAEKAKKGVQLVFLDFGTPKDPGPLEFMRGVTVSDQTEGELSDESDMVDDGEDVDAVVDDDEGLFSMYDAVKRALIERGIPSREIAYIHSAQTSAERIALFQAANEGRVRFVFASTDKGGVGMNIQTRLAAVHELDAPRKQRPGDLRQRMGRAIRQGNIYEAVRLIRYVTQGTTDEWLWSMLNTKDYQIRKFMKGDAFSMTEADPSIQQAIMFSSHDPRAVELIDLKSKQVRLQAQASAAQRAQIGAEADLKRAQAHIKRLTQRLETFDAWEKGWSTKRGDKFEMEVRGKTYTKTKEADEALIAQAARINEMQPDQSVRVGSIGGLPLFGTYSKYTLANKSGTRGTVHHVVRLRIDASSFDGGDIKAVEFDTEEGGVVGEGQRPSAGVVNAYEGIPQMRGDIAREIQTAEATASNAQRTLNTPAPVVELARENARRIDAIERELKAESDANEKARQEAKSAAKPGEPETAGHPMGGGTLEEMEVSDAGSALPLDAIIAELSRVFDGIPVSVGHYSQRKRAIYKIRQHAIRSRKANDLYAVAHEIGHHIDMALMRGSAVHKRGDIAKELKALGVRTATEGATAQDVRAEGAAEFFRLWLLNPAAAIKQAPLYSEAFDRWLAENPERRDGLVSVRGQVQRYLSSSAVDQARLHIDYEGGSSTVMAQAYRMIQAVTDTETRKAILTEMSAELVDDLAWLRRAENDMSKGRPIDITESAYALARLARGSAGKAEGFLRYGVRNAAGQIVGTSLDKALAPVLSRLEDFDLYRVAVHAKEMEEQGVSSGLTRTQIRATIDALKSPEFDDAIDRLREFHSAMRGFLVEAGILSQDASRKMARRWETYVPMQRVIEAASRGFSGQGIANKRSPIKRMKGSTRRVIRPLESDIRNTHAQVAAADLNRAMLALVRTIEKTPGSARWMEEIPAPQVATRFSLAQVEEEIRKSLDDAGIQVPDNMSFDEIATVWTPRQFARGNERFVTVVDNGRIRWFEVHEPGLYDAITAIGPQNTGDVVRLFWRGAKTLRSFATATLGFILRNPVRDVMVARTQSRAGFTPLDFLRGLFDYVGHGEDYQKFLHSGAAQATLVASDRDVLRKRIKELGRSRRRQLLDSTILNPIDGLRALSEVFENATRLGEFKRSLRKSDGSTSALLQAGLNARDVTQDFAVAGRTVRAWNQYVAFFSARVGGLSRMYQAAMEGGGGKGGGRDGVPPSAGGAAQGGFGEYGSHGEPGAIGFLWRALTSVTLLSVLLWVLNHDDDEYRNLPEWERRAYWHIPVPGGYLRIVKPFEVGQLFGTFTEDALDWLAKEGKPLAERLPDRSSALQLVLMMVPTAILPVVQVESNYDFFKGREIVNPYDTDLEPELQYSRWTTETAKALGRWLKMSPAKIESLVFGYTAGAGKGVLQGIDLATGATQHRPSSDPGQWPGVGAFYRARASSDAQVLTDFYEARDQIAGIKQSVRRFIDRGEADKAEALRNKSASLLAREPGIRAGERMIQGHRATIGRIFDDASIPPAQKRRMLDAEYRSMQQIARRSLGLPPLP